MKNVIELIESILSNMTEDRVFLQKKLTSKLSFSDFSDHLLFYEEGFISGDPN